MKITQTAQKIKGDFAMDVSVDVHKDTLNCFFETEGKEYYDEFSNRNTLISKKLQAYHEVATTHGIQTLRIICEPTGQYQNKLFRTARKMGFLTCLVNTESVAKYRIIETNDTGKTDIKDPRVIRTLGQLNKTIRHRHLDNEYLMLRKLNRLYDECQDTIISLKGRINKLLVELFCDYSFKKDFLYSRSGTALFEKFNCNPYRIVKTGHKRFCKMMKKAAPRIRQESLQRLWDDAQSSILNELPQEYIEILCVHLQHLMQDYRQQAQRKEAAAEKMVMLLKKLREKDPNIPTATRGVINEKNIARLIGETGPIRDFKNWRMLMRYAGLNIRMRQSGKYNGQNKISKKGRASLRKILMNIALPMVKRERIYGAYYHRKKEEDKMVGNKAMICVARHFIRKFYGWYKSGKAFDLDRFFTCEAQYRRAA